MQPEHTNAHYLIQSQDQQQHTLTPLRWLVAPTAAVPQLTSFRLFYKVGVGNDVHAGPWMSSNFAKIIWFGVVIKNTQSNLFLPNNCFSSCLLSRNTPGR